MPGICDVPNEVLTLIATFEHGVPKTPIALPRLPPPQLALRRKSGRRAESILQPPDLGAWSRTCRHFYDRILPLLYAFNRDIQFSSAVAWAAQHNSISTLERAQEHKLSLTGVRNLYCPGACRLTPVMVSKRLFLPVHPVQFALLQGHIETVGWFLDHGLDVNANLATLCRCSPPLPRTLCLPPLHIAICGGQPAAVPLLIERGANLKYEHTRLPGFNIGVGIPNSRVVHRSAIHEAAEHGLYTTVEYLVRNAGLDVHSTDHYGNTVLACAIRRDDNVVMVQRLLDLGAHVDDFMPKWEDSLLCKAISQGRFLVAMVLLDSATTATAEAARRWRTKALLWSILKTGGNTDVNNHGDTIPELSTDGESTDTATSDSDSDLPGPSRIWRGSNSVLYLTSSDEESDRRSIAESTSTWSSTSSSSSSSSSNSTSSSGSTSDSNSAYMPPRRGCCRIKYLDPKEPWNLRRKSFMLRLLELGVDIENEGRPLLTFSQEAWVTQLLLDAGADPNMPRRNRPQKKDEYPLGLRMESEYLAPHKKLWAENAKVLLEHGARIDKTCGGVFNHTILVDVVDRSGQRHWRSKLQFLLAHSTSRNLTQTHLDEVLDLCFRYRTIRGCEMLTKYGAKGRPSTDAVYDMIKDVILSMRPKKQPHVVPETDSEHSSSDDSKTDSAHNFPNLAFLLRYGLPSVHFTLLLAKAIKHKVFNAAHMLLDHGANQHLDMSQFLEHLLILAAESGSLAIVRRLWSGGLLDATFALQAAVLRNHRAVVLFFIDEGANMLCTPSSSMFAGIRCLPEEEKVLKGKANCTDRWWEKEKTNRRRRIQARDRLASFDLKAITNPSVSALQFAVYAAKTATVRCMVRSLGPRTEGDVREPVKIPCVLAKANELHELLATKGLTS